VILLASLRVSGNIGTRHRDLRDRMFESLGIDFVTPRGASVLLGLCIGLAFGALALATGFCFRRAVAGPREERASALGLWLVALTAAVIGTQASVYAGFVSFADHRFLNAGVPALAIITGGALFGAGMVLARGCASRLCVLAGTGNLRALLVVLVIAVAGMATLRGVLAPLRLWMSGASLSVGGALPGPPALWIVLLAVVAFSLALRAGVRPGQIAMGLALGLLVPLAWVGTGLVLFDDFDPIPFESLSFTGPTADTLFWTVAASAVPAGFGTGLIGGTLLGSLALALASGRFHWQSFSAPRETGRYLAGGLLMGFGGVLAGGCTVGAGLAGIPTLGIAAVLALAAIAMGGIAMNGFLSLASRGSAAPDTRPQARPVA